MVWWVKKVANDTALGSVSTDAVASFGFPYLTNSISLGRQDLSKNAGDG